MKPLYLELAHFGPYSDIVCLDFENELNDGLFVITGPTGAGKSTIFEAIYFALYGDSTKKERGSKDYRSDFSKEKSDLSYVKLRFLVKDEIYEITRTPLQILPKKKGQGYREQKHEVVFLKYNDDKVAPLTRIDEVKAKIEELLGLNQEQFKKIVMLPQGDFHNFLLADTQEKKIILRTLFGTEQYLLFQERMKEETAEMKKLYDSMTKEIEWLFHSNFGENIQDLSLAYEVLTTEINHKEEKENNLKKLQREIEEKNVYLDQLFQRLKEESALEETKYILGKHLTKEQDVIYFKEKLKKIDEVLLLAPKENDLSNLHQRIEMNRLVLAKLNEEIKNHETKKVLWHKNENNYQVHLRNLEKYNKGLTQIENELERSKTYQIYQKTLLTKKKELEEQEFSFKSVSEKEDKTLFLLGQIEEKLCKLTDLKITLAYNEQNLLSLQKREDNFKEYFDTKNAVVTIEKKEKDLIKVKDDKTKIYENLKESYVKLKDKVFELYRSELAKLLKEDKPCPVCGSLNHDRPFQGTFEVSLSDYESLEYRLKEAQEDLTIQIKKIEQVDYEKNLLFKQLIKLEKTIDASKSEIEKKYDVLKREIEDLNNERKKALESLKDEDQLIKTKCKLLDQKKEDEEKKEILKKNCAVLREDIASLLGLLKAYEGESYEELIEKKHTLETEITKSQSLIRKHENLGKILNQNEIRFNTEKETIIKDLKESEENYKRKNEVFNGLIDKQFSSFAYYEEIKKDVVRKDIINSRISLWEQEKARLENEVKSLEKRINALPTGESKPLSEELESLKERYQEESHKLGALSQSIKVKTTAFQNIKEKYNILDNIASEYGKVHILVKLATGENKWRMDFETFVLVYYYDKVLHFANVRLKKMSDGRYFFVRQVEINDKRKQSGLGLDIMDEYTGRKRQVSTLSGGESFKAALALALGLSDVVREESGGMALDTIFIDEGFGTLDEDALDTTLDTLMELEEGGRLVGIISHVTELKERIVSKLIVESNKEGSHAYFEANL